MYDHQHQQVEAGSDQSKQGTKWINYLTPNKTKNKIQKTHAKQKVNK